VCAYPTGKFGKKQKIIAGGLCALLIKGRYFKRGRETQNWEPDMRRGRLECIINRKFSVWEYFGVRAGLVLVGGSWLPEGETGGELTNHKKKTTKNEHNVAALE
jgi:hypothetical protein